MNALSHWCLLLQTQLIQNFFAIFLDVTSEHRHQPDQLGVLYSEMKNFVVVSTVRFASMFSSFFPAAGT